MMMMTEAKRKRKRKKCIHLLYTSTTHFVPDGELEEEDVQELLRNDIIFSDHTLHDFHDVEDETGMSKFVWDIETVPETEESVEEIHLQRTTTTISQARRVKSSQKFFLSFFILFMKGRIIKAGTHQESFFIPLHQNHEGLNVRESLQEVVVAGEIRGCLTRDQTSELFQKHIEDNLHIDISDQME